jgi:hypothetical protein
VAVDQGAVILRSIDLSLEVDRGVPRAVLNGETESAVEQFRFMASGRDQSLADHEANTRVGSKRGIWRPDHSD